VCPLAGSGTGGAPQSCVTATTAFKGVGEKHPVVLGTHATALALFKAGDLEGCRIL